MYAFGLEWNFVQWKTNVVLRHGLEPWYRLFIYLVGAGKAESSTEERPHSSANFSSMNRRNIM